MEPDIALRRPKPADTDTAILRSDTTRYSGIIPNVRYNRRKDVRDCIPVQLAVGIVHLGCTCGSQSEFGLVLSCAALAFRYKRR
jgi:hypothetical protein